MVESQALEERETILAIEGVKTEEGVNPYILVYTVVIEMQYAW